MNTLILKKFIKQENKTSQDGNNYKYLTFVAIINGEEQFINFSLAPFKQNAIDLAKVVKEHMNKEILVENQDLTFNPWTSKTGKDYVQINLKHPITYLRKLDNNLFLPQSERIVAEW